MSDGWETKRRRGPGNDWVIVRLATEGRVRRVEIDTNHFKGNYPDTASIDGSRDGKTWTELLPRTKLQAHTRHFFVDELATDEPFTHLRLNVFPDGGVSRLRVWGVPTPDGRRAAAVQHINTLAGAERELLKVCGSNRWASAIASKRPYASWDKLVETSDRIWMSLDPRDWLEAFSAHPKIGEKKRGWSTQEQSGTRNASEETMRELARAQDAYLEKFGFIYLVNATGKTADEMLADVKQRLSNDREVELKRGAEEQRQIIALRLEKLV
jgi:allantoicase